MSDFVGPNSYVIESALTDELAIEIYSGKKEDGAKVDVWRFPDKTDSKASYAHWEFVYLGTGPSDRDEYLILNHFTGTYLTAPENPKSGNPITASTISPRKIQARWNLIPTRNKTGRFWISPVGDKGLTLNIAGGGKENGGGIILWPIEGNLGALNQQWYLRFSNDFTGQFPDTKAATG